MPSIRNFGRSLPALMLSAGLACAATAPASTASAALAMVEQPANFVKPEDRNAAIRYWQYLSMIDNDATEKLREVDWDAIGDSLDPADMPAWYHSGDADADLYFPQLKSVADGLVETSRMSRCNFETAYENGIFALIPHLGPMRNGARLLRVAARVSMVEGKPEQAAEYVAAIVRMAHHASEEPILIGSLVGIAMTGTAMDEAESLLRTGKLTSQARRTILNAFEKLPTDDPMNARSAVAGERDIFLPWIDRVAGDGKTLNEVASMIVGEDESTQKAFLDLINRGPEAVRADVKRAREPYTMVIEAWDQPGAPERLEQINHRVANGDFGALAQVLFPSFVKTAETDRKFQARLEAVKESLRK